MSPLIVHVHFPPGRIGCTSTVGGVNGLDGERLHRPRIEPGKVEVTSLGARISAHRPRGRRRKVAKKAYGLAAWAKHVNLLGKHGPTTTLHLGTGVTRIFGRFPGHQLCCKRFNNNVSARERFNIKPGLCQKGHLLAVRLTVIGHRSPPLQVRPVATNDLQASANSPATRAGRESGPLGD
jgi:hypothetical protein